MKAFLLCFIVFLLLPGHAAGYEDEKSYCMRCHGREIAMAFGDGKTLSLKVSVPNSVHSKLACSDCHYGFSSEEHPNRRFRTERDYAIASTESCRRCHFDKYIKTLDGIHFAVMSQGNLKAPVCTDCHGSHTVTRVERTGIASKCRPCHEKTYDAFRNSVHGKAVFEGHNPDAPVCTDCHGSHDIKSPISLRHRERVPEMCGRCHADEKVMKKYGLSTNVLSTYLADFHGVTLELYKHQKNEMFKPARPVAVCTDCHGNHNIVSTISPESPTVKANLVKMCRRCHVNATDNFPEAWLSHYEPSLAKAPMIFVVTRLYEFFIPITLIGLGLQILLHAWRYLVNR